MFWGTLFTIAVRVIMVWLYADGGSVFVVSLFHAIGNTGRSLFPGGRAAFELGDATVAYGLVTLSALALVVSGLFRRSATARP
jgi:hypothetical protein